MLATATTSAVRPSILEGGCIPPWITPTLPTEPKPWDRGCWDPRRWGTIQLPSPDADVQARAGASELG